MVISLVWLSVRCKILIQFFTTSKKTKFKISTVSVQQNKKRNKTLAGGFQ